MDTYTHTSILTFIMRYILWLIDLLLGNGSVNTFPRRQIMGKQPLLCDAYNNMQQ
jgi:hypothetical protein